MRIRTGVGVALAGVVLGATAGVLLGSVMPHGPFPAAPVVAALALSAPSPSPAAVVVVVPEGRIVYRPHLLVVAVRRLAVDAPGVATGVVLDQKDLAMMQDAAHRMRSAIIRWSAGQVVPRIDVGVLDEPARSLSPDGHVRWLGPDDLLPLLGRDTAASYDGVLSVWRPSGPWRAGDPDPVFPAGIAGGGRTAPRDSGLGYSTYVLPADRRGGVGLHARNLAEALVHEWLHQVMFEAEGHAVIPDLHAVDAFGYSAVDGSWRAWYRDLMSDRLPVTGGGHAGISRRDWALIATLDRTDRAERAVDDGAARD